MIRRLKTLPAVVTAFTLVSGEALASDGGGQALGLVWVLPFVGILLSIAVLPLVASQFWHHHFGKISVFWALAFAIPYAIVAGPAEAAHAVWHTIALEYIPFIVLIYALFVVAGGILVRGGPTGTPLANTGMLAFGTSIASLLGTTGAAMLMVRPMIRANADRPFNAHVFIFFIFLVANIGGSLTPLGDPPLYLGFLQGVEFFWTTEHLLGPMIVTAGILLGVFFLLDSYHYRREPRSIHGGDDKPVAAFEVLGGHNILLLLAIIAAVLLSGLIDPAIAWPVFGVEIHLDSIVRSLALISIGYVSLKTTRTSVRIENAFSWGPIIEVALLFFGIFIAMIPALAILQAGSDGALAGLIALVTRPDGTPDTVMYFWLTGTLSAFLDNAPTYLVFFNVAGGDPQLLMTSLAPTLTAISAGAVFMGAISYIGNAPNFMVKSICEERGIRMPSFFGYIGWSLVFLVPVFILDTLLFFR